MPTPAQKNYVLAFDTANDVIAIGAGFLEPTTKTITEIASLEVAAHRASNTRLLEHIDTLLSDNAIPNNAVSCIAAGRGPGSFTGVRIALATAKGIASALEVPLIGISTLDAIAWNTWDYIRPKNPEGNIASDMISTQKQNTQKSLPCTTLLVLADAMRKEVYPARFEFGETGPLRIDPDSVEKAADAAKRFGGCPERFLCGDALYKYFDLFSSCGTVLPEKTWTPTGKSLLLALQAAWQADEADPFDARRHKPAFALPVYTRLSDAEENERKRLGSKLARNLVTGVQAEGSPAEKTETGQENTYESSAQAGNFTKTMRIIYRPLDSDHVSEVAELERTEMGENAWSETLIKEDLSQPGRSWWGAYLRPGSPEDDAKMSLIGYVGSLITAEELQILRLCVASRYRRRGIARALLGHASDDAKNLSANRCVLEVRTDNAAAQDLYASLDMQVIGRRTNYYSKTIDALVMEGPLPIQEHDVAGMELISHTRATEAPELKEPKRPLILAIETSCDETAAAITDASETLLADILASQVDFHARFGGVVPEIASRKHIEAICGVCDECLDVAARAIGAKHLCWQDLDAIAATYTPGLVGALVVGVAFAKGAAWAAQIPFIGVNHLEGHLYANKIGTPDFAPPAVVSLVSGGNTMLVYMKDWGEYITLGETIDDAVGEAFDKVAKALGLEYPGGPAIAKLAEKGDACAISFPRAMIHSKDLCFSLSGLKTAVMTYLDKEKTAGRKPNLADIAASFQAAVIDVQIAKAKKALEQTGAKTFALGGGVAANTSLRKAYETLCAQMGVRLVLPPMSACGDNAAMIALVALDRYYQKKFFSLDADAYACANLDDPY